jgi:hypothetical protein
MFKGARAKYVGKYTMSMSPTGSQELKTKTLPRLVKCQDSFKRY